MCKCVQYYVKAKIVYVNNVEFFSTIKVKTLKVFTIKTKTGLIYWLVLLLIIVFP